MVFTLQQILRVPEALTLFRALAFTVPGALVLLHALAVTVPEALVLLHVLAVVYNNHILTSLVPQAAWKV